MLGDALYEAYLKGRSLTKHAAPLFLVHLEEPGVAKEMFREIAAKVRCNAQEAAGLGHAVDPDPKSSAAVPAAVWWASRPPHPRRDALGTAGRMPALHERVANLDARWLNPEC